MEHGILMFTGLINIDKKNILFYFIFLILIPFYLTANESKTDSLLQKLKEVNIDTVKISVLNELARQYRNSDLSQATFYADEAISLAIRINYNGIELANAYNVKGILQYYKSNYDSALFYYIIALKIREKLDDKIGIAAAYNNIGMIYSKQNNMSMALDNYLKSLKIRESLNDKSGMANSYQSIGNIHLHQNNDSLAMEYYLKSMVLYIELGDEKALGILYGNIGNSYMKANDFNEAMKFYLKALNLSEKYNDKQAELSHLNNIAHLYSMRNDYRNIITYSLGSLNLSQKMNVKSSVLVSYQNLASAYEALNDFKQANNYYKLYATLKDTIFNEQSSKQMAEIQTKYETEKKEKEIILLNKDNELQQAQLNKQQIIIWFIIVGLLLTGISSFISYRSFLHKKKANILLEAKNKMIEKQRNDILASINYAKNIQKSMLMREEEVQRILPFENFIFFRPKDIVSGDFYWFNKQEDKYLIAAVDCTGHGVPGGFMSMIGNSLLNEIVLKMKITKPSEILSTLNILIRDTLRQTTDNSHTQDGMDMALCTIDIKNRILEYAGARNPLYIISPTLTFSETEQIKYFPVENNEGKGLYVLKADSFSIGGKNPSILQGKEKTYMNHELPLTPDTTIYLFSDGYIDQHGGTERKKLGSPRFREIIQKYYNENSVAQKECLANEIKSWQGKYKQTDDMLIIGCKINL